MTSLTQPADVAGPHRRGLLAGCGDSDVHDRHATPHLLVDSLCRSCGMIHCSPVDVGGVRFDGTVSVGVGGHEPAAGIVVGDPTIGDRVALTVHVRGALFAATRRPKSGDPERLTLTVAVVGPNGSSAEVSVPVPRQPGLLDAREIVSVPAAARGNLRIVVTLAGHTLADHTYAI